ncbi:MAG: hypothetical protein KGJ06_00200 [Pseudomonadota bacterium]|nr:hypothetical protein [Pseudomonadota bacterium]
MKRGSIRSIVGFSAIALLLSASGCTMYRLEELRHTTPQGSPFQNALSKLYMDFAAQEEREYDWYNSWHFADKGLKAAYGKDVPPEDLADWNIPEEQLPYLQKGREALLAALTPANRERHPVEAAQAQFSFDCWVEEQEENWQWDDIGRCRDGLADALASLGAPSGDLIAPGTPVEVAQPQADRISYMVFFPDAETSPSAAGAQAVDKIIASLKGAKDYAVILRIAGGGKPTKLFRQRAEVVKARLATGGVASAAITVDGEAKNPAARQVEIFINQ